MPLKSIITWLKRATGVGYRRYDPLVGRDVDVEKSARLRERTDKLVRDVDQLERELRKIGLRIPPFGQHGD
jgi:hypothetical protein